MIDTTALYAKYGKKRVEEAAKLLLYKKTKSKIPKPLPKSESKKPILYVVRHAQSEDNVRYIFGGWRDSNITEKGKQQALTVAEKLKDKHFDMLVCSDLKRTKQTLELAISLNEEAKKLPIIEEPQIKERNYGDLQGRNKLEMYLENAELTQKYRRSYDTPPPNGESLKQTINRVQEYLLEELLPKMKNENINVLLVGHGNSVRGIRMYFENLTEFEVTKIETPLAQDYCAYEIN
jgi:2,3-bisphosphoglycerate-dependent phosphoglycerate mutase